VRDAGSARVSALKAEDVLLISIQTGMLVALGFLIASLLWLVLASAFWSRAVRLTTERLKRSMPVSDTEIKADRDRLKAEHAIKVHKLETQLEQAKLERARQLIEINRRDASISALETEIVALRADLEENQNARRVLEQTVADRLPKVEARLAEAKRLLFNRDREIAELAENAKRHKLALEEASSMNAQKTAQIDRLNATLTTRGRRSGASPSGDESALRAEVEALRTKTREQAALIDRLQRRLGASDATPGAVAAQSSEGGEARRAQEALSEAEAALRSVQAPSAGEAGRPEHEREVRALEARVEDQAGEIARLKAALAAFEQADSGGLKNSKLALKVRAGSAEAHAERQAATISRLRAELAAANERLARQAARFMDEMRRIGGGTAASAPRSQAEREGGRRKLVERVAQVRPALAEKTGAAAPSANVPEAANPAEKAAGNGHDAKPQANPVAEQAPEKAATAAPAASPAAAEMPQTEAIPEERRRVRLLDRITSLSKS
jgi:DNA repair exonuclease SbcCD ATPase subunit